MSRLKAKWIYKDTNTLEDDGSGNLRVRVVAAGAIEAVTGVGGLGGLNIKSTGITNGMLAGGITSDKIDSTFLASIIRANGSVAFSADQSMGTHKLTNLLAGTSATDAVNVAQLQASIAGLTWKDPVNMLETDSALLPFNTSSSSGAGSHTGFRVLINGTGLGDFAGHSNQIATYTAEETWTFETPSDNWAVFDMEYDQGYTFNGSIWVQFTGAGSITAGAGLTQAGNIINIGQKNGNGAGTPGGAIKVNADDIEVQVDNTTLQISDVNGNPGVMSVKKVGASQLDQTASYDFSASGTVRVANQTQGNNSTLAANTAYVDAALTASVGEVIKQEMFLIGAGDVTAGFVTLTASTGARIASNVQVQVQYGPCQVNKQCVGSTGATPDFDVLTDGTYLKKLHINNNGGASGLSGDIVAGDIIIATYGTK